jgi:drug/metabolite transporter (DMT)-like permease
MNKIYIRGILFSAFGGIGWGVSGVCSQYLFSTYTLDSAWLTTVRMILSGILLLAVTYIGGDRHLFRVFRSGSDRTQILLFAVMGLLMCQYAFLSAIKFTNSGTATVLQSLNVVLLMIFLSLRTRSVPNKIQLLSIFLAFSGVFLIATNGNPKALIISPVGLFWGILSAVGVVSYTLLSKKLISTWGNTVISGWGMLIGGVFLSLISQTLLLPPSLDFTGVLVVLTIVVIGTAGAFSFFLEGVKIIGPMKATLIACLEPFTATLLSSLLLHTSFSFMDIVGFVFIIATVILSTFSGRIQAKSKA